MTLPSPRLDDRDFASLMREAERLIGERCPGWTDLSPSDPGITLIEVFAYLTDIMIYRLNRVPEKVHVALLNLLGVAPIPPSAAMVTLNFSRDGDSGRAVHIPVGTEVSDSSGAIRFATIVDLDLAAGAATGSVAAVNGELVEAERLGIGTGEPGQSFRVQRPPVLRTMAGLDTVILGVEAARDEAGGGQVRAFDGRGFGLWGEVDSFADNEGERWPFMIDRFTGTVLFQPAGGLTGAGAAIGPATPAKGREVRMWYWRGGGRAGNVGPGTLTVLRQPVPGITVTNPARASGGEDGETVKAAIDRGREAVRGLRTAVTARDFERVAREAGGIAKARAYAQRDLWMFGEPGVVDVQLVPRIDEQALAGGAITPAVLAAHQTPELLERVASRLRASRPIGVRTSVGWTRCRPVGIGARIVVAPVEDPAAVRERLVGRLNDLLSPTGRLDFDRTLRASDAYEAILAEPGVRYVEELSFTIESGPEREVRDLLADPRQDRAFYAATNTGLFRTLDRGRSWSRLENGLPDQRFVCVRADPETPGLLAAVAERDPDSWAVHISRDGGESWSMRDLIQNEEVFDAAWLVRDARPILFLATRRALRRLDIGDRSESTTPTPGGPATVVPGMAAVRSAGQGSTNVAGLLKTPGTNGGIDSNGFFAVATGRHALGVPFVAVAARDKRGVLVSLQGGEAHSFDLLPGVAGKDVRVLTFQRDAGRSYLWAGVAAEAGAEGEGVLRIEARADGIDPGGWTSFSKGWKGGSCSALDFAPPMVVAGSNRAGVLVLDGVGSDGAWRAPPIDCGLPINAERTTLLPTAAVAAGPGMNGAVVIAGTQSGLYTSADGRRFSAIGRTSFTDQVPLPPNWLYCAGEHTLNVMHEQDNG
jgi:hypothetical protein